MLSPSCPLPIGDANGFARIACWGEAYPAREGGNPALRGIAGHPRYRRSDETAFDPITTNAPQQRVNDRTKRRAATAAHVGNGQCITALPNGALFNSKFSEFKNSR